MDKPRTPLAFNWKTHRSSASGLHHNQVARAKAEDEQTWETGTVFLHELLISIPMPILYIVHAFLTRFWNHDIHIHI
jgi:hypothetical protein